KYKAENETVKTLDYNKTIYVNAEIGDDTSGQGTQEFPFQTLSCAISQHQDEGTIALLGESYKYYELNDSGIKDIPYGVSLISDANQSDDRQKMYLGRIVLHGNNTLRSLNIDADIMVEEGHNKIESCFIEYSTIQTINQSQLEIRNTTIESSGGTILHALNQSTLTLINTTVTNNLIYVPSSAIAIKIANDAFLKLQESNINNNYIGIMIKDNGLIESSLPKTTISNNVKCDLLHTGKKEISLNHIQWDHSMGDLTVSDICQNGNDIIGINGASISYDGKVPSLDTPSFETENENFIFRPKFGETVTRSPTFEFTNNGNKYIKIAVWDTYPIIINNIIQNPDYIVWSWNNTSANDELGHLYFYEGIYNESIIEQYTFEYGPDNIYSFDYISFKAGIYYIVVWEWDDQGIEVISSSNISYFYVSGE
nr:hypothetical protein [Campylobacterota bacterium]